MPEVTETEQEKLGICVSTTRNLSHVIGLAKAAHGLGKRVDVFFTGEAVRLSKDPRFSELLDVARVGICELSYLGNGYRGEPVEGLVDRDFVTQMRNAEMVEQCDRYLNL